jgi:predicted outer membrane repeat protein
MERSSRILRVAALVAIVLGALLPSATASANDYTADLLSDSNVTVCPPNPNVIQCSLREAVSAAIVNPGADRVILIAGTHSLTLGPDSGFENQNGDIDYFNDAIGPGGNLEILGAGAPPVISPGGTTVDATGIPGGGDGARAFDFFGDYPVTIRGLAITGGHTAFGGGAIKSTQGALLTLEDVVINGNSAGTTGGAIDSTGVGLVVSHSRFYDNTSQQAGGAIALRSCCNSGSHIDLITRSAFSGNRTLSPGMGGGAMAVFGDGGGPQVDPFVTVENSTFDSNRATGYGGAIDVFGNATGILRFSTVTRNRANDDNTGTEAGGGLQSGGGLFSLYGNLIADNALGTGGVNPDCNGGFNSTGYNALTSLTGCSGLTAPGDLVTASPGIGPLTPITDPQSAGGTVPLLAGSPAIDRVPADASCPATDQGLRTRPIGPGCDSGARECAPVSAPCELTPSPAAAPSPKPAVKKCKKKRRSASSAKKKKKKKKCKKKRGRR